MTTTSNPFAEPLPNDLASAHALILAQREMLIVERSDAKVRALEIERLKLLLAKARREAFGQSSERGKLLVDQLELAIEDLEEAQGEEEAKADIAAPEATRQRPRSLRGPRKLPDNLPVERRFAPRPSPTRARRTSKPCFQSSKPGGKCIRWAASATRCSGVKPVTIRTVPPTAAWETNSPSLWVSRFQTGPFG